MTQLTGQTIVGRYRVTRELGSGGMGTVYLTEHIHLGRPTAIKLLRAALSQDPLAEQRFRREAMLAARINHPNIAQVYDFDCTPSGQFVLAMEFVEGETVAQRLRRSGPFALTAAAPVLLAVGEGLEHAHRFGVLHRDLKPENVMLGPAGLVKLLDFGVARPLDTTSGITSADHVVGTPAYMSPEQLLGEALTPATDIYSLGVVFYEMVTGQVPHGGGGFHQIRARRLLEPPPLLSVVHPDCPAELAAVVGRALEIDPGQRWPSAREFVEAVAETLASPVPQTRAAVPAPGARSPRRDRWEANFEALRFAGRNREIRRVRDAWAAARAGRTTVLWIEGDEGAGKSAFFALARREARSDGAAELIGHGYEAGFAHPYGPWLGMLRGALELHAARERRWPAIEALTDASLATPVPERAILADEVGLLLGQAARRGPLLVGLEDADCADSASLGLLEFLTAQLRDVPVLIALTADAFQGRSAARVREMRETIGRVSHLIRVRLEPLDEEAVTAWLNDALGRAAPPALLRYVLEHSEGNPFFIAQVMRSLLDSGDMERVSDETRITLAAAPPPEAVADVVRRRLERMSATAREVLLFAAVVGREFDVELLMELSGHAEEPVLDALDDAVEAGVLEPVEPRGNRYRFTHGKIAQVHAQRMNPRRRSRLHAQVAEALGRRSDADPGDVAWHWYHAGEPERAWPAAAVAAERALAVHDAEDALTYAALAAETARDQTQHRIAHERRGDALRRLDRHAEAAQAYARARRGGPSDQMIALRCKELRSALAAGAVDAAEAAREARGLAQATESFPDESRAPAAVLLAEALLAEGCHADAAAAAERAHDVALRAGIMGKAGDALLVTSAARRALGDPDGAARAADEAGALFAELGDDLGAARAALLRGAVALAVGDRSTARLALDGALRRAERARVERLVGEISRRLAEV